MLAELRYNIFFLRKSESTTVAWWKINLFFFSEMQTIEKHELAVKRKAIHEQSSLIQWI